MGGARGSPLRRQSAPISTGNTAVRVGGAQRVTEPVMGGDREQETGSPASGTAARRSGRVEASDIEREIKAPKPIHVFGHAVEFMVFLGIVCGIVAAVLRSCHILDG